MTVCFGSVALGSSPRWRGKLAKPLALALGAGLIPALAGKTEPSTSRRARLSAHPRAGGENSINERTVADANGSSPRWRGKLHVTKTLSSPEGLIPALAGKTSLKASWKPQRTAHPRAGGENENSISLPTVPNGSSPRWRGKRLPRSARQGPRRLIPALAGKTSAFRAFPRSTSAHPRAGGENRGHLDVVLTVNGSSPRWRGKPRPCRRRRRVHRLIPALAGKTSRRRVRFQLFAAHPRAGGENPDELEADFYRFGSSPRWRGKQPRRPANQR